MFARSIRLMLLSLILMVVACALEARACDDMDPAVASSDRHEATSPEQGLLDVTNAKEPKKGAWLDTHDVDGCLPRCCQSNVCCHLLALSPVPDLWSAGGEIVAALVATDGTPRSSEPDVPPPKAI